MTKNTSLSTQPTKTSSKLGYYVCPKKSIKKVSIKCSNPSKSSEKETSPLSTKYNESLMEPSLRSKPSQNKAVSMPKTAKKV